MPLGCTLWLRAPGLHAVVARCGCVYALYAPALYSCPCASALHAAAALPVRPCVCSGVLLVLLVLLVLAAAVPLQSAVRPPVQ